MYEPCTPKEKNLYGDEYRTIYNNIKPKHDAVKDYDSD